MVPLYKFYRHKYGKELLVDVIDIDNMRNSIRHTPDFMLSFFSLLIIIDGNEPIGINGHYIDAKRGVVICSRPGEVWSWQNNTSLQGLEFIFEERFLLSFFNDPHFLDRFAYLQPERRSPFLILDDELITRLTQLYHEMKKEIDLSTDEKGQHILRAMLYETLMLLGKAQTLETDDVNSNKVTSAINISSLNRHINAFTQLVNDNYIAHHDVDFYAERLFITPNYLNKIVRRTFGISTKQYIQNHVMDEAERLLKFTSLSVVEIAEQLHYNTSTYFIRQFSKNKGRTPQKFRSPEK